MSAKKYFVYELKKALFAIGSIALIMTAITVTRIITDYYVFGYRIESGVDVSSFMGGLLAAVVPVWMFSYKMKKRSVDLFYSLPLKRSKILGVKYLLGLIALYAPYTTAFWLGALAAAIKYPSYVFDGVYYIPTYFAALPALFCIFSLSSFVFTRAERVIDGVVFIVFWAFALFAVMSVLQKIFGYAIAADMYMPTAPLNAVANYFIMRIEIPGMYVRESIETTVNRAVGFSITGLIAIAASIFLFLTEKRSRAENIGGVSASPFGYKVMIPLLTVCTIAYLDIVDDIYEVLLVVIAASAAFMLSALYMHTFKIGKVQAIVLGGSVALGILLAVVFGLTL